MRTTLRLTLTISAMMLMVMTAAWADVPANMNVQGKLTDGGGVPSPAGLYIFTYRVFDASAAGNQVWPANGAIGEEETVAVGADGLWNGCVGLDTSLTETTFQDTSLWLEITVDNGIDPPETLSRMKFKTNPFSYRSASAQQADSLGGLTASDIEDLYVNSAGDLMTGNLQIDGAGIRNNWSTGPDSLANIFAENESGVWDLNLTPTSNRGIGGIATSDGPEAKVGVIALAAGEGAGDVYGMWSFVLGSAPKYSGYFGGGDFVIDAPATPGDASVTLPANAISSGEMLNEPGIAQGRVEGNVSVSGEVSMIDIVTVSLTIPSDGYIVVDANAQARLSGTISANRMSIQIDETAGGPIDNSYYHNVGATPANTASMYMTAHAQRTYFKPEGTYTFRFEALDESQAGGSKFMWNPVITARFFPTSYGTVTTIATSAEAEAFESAKALPAIGAQNGTTVGAPAAAFEVDLRELELRVARAEAAAQEAKLDLMQAQVSSEKLQVDE